MTDGDRDRGTILLNSWSGPYRRRYSLAHELGHFLCGWHQQTSSRGFLCSAKDMARTSGGDIHIRQESEANQFAIELLAPERLIAQYLKRLPELEQVLAIHSALEISKTAAARRYVNLHREPLAVIFANNGLYQYAVRGAGFPYIKLSRGHPLRLCQASTATTTSRRWWKPIPSTGPACSKQTASSVQVIQQERGHSIVLLHIASDDPDAG